MKKSIIILAVLSLLVIALAIACDSSVDEKLFNAKEDKYLTFSSAKSFKITPSYDEGKAQWGTYVYDSLNDSWDFEEYGILEYSTDAKNWTAFATDKITSAISAQGSDGKYYLYIRGKGNNVVTDSEEWEISHINLQDKDGVDCYGNIMTLLDYDNPSSTKMGKSCFRYMFYDCELLSSAPTLSAMKLEESCYGSMFHGCTSLEAVPNLPALKLAKGCYQLMFSGCEKLTTIPETLLPATELSEECYYEMFSYSGLASIPERLLHSNKLAAGCYREMFKGCTSLVTVPANLLPATTLSALCYYYMFSGCTNLTNAPNLPATTLANQCCERMFNGCTSLKIKVKDSAQDNVFLVAQTPTEHDWYPYQNMFSGTNGAFKDYPTAGKSYAWYLDD